LNLAGGAGRGRIPGLRRNGKAGALRRIDGLFTGYLCLFV
jgi:hypothetical protein